MTDPSSGSLPRRARIVIIGGGVIGTSVVYHLTRRGLTDVLLLEQGQLSCGTTWHAAGLVGQLRASESGTRLVQYSTRLYDQAGDRVPAVRGRHGRQDRGPAHPAAPHRGDG
jgi:4-methylaminobutanoate oxidase (formaldehyde-forming)